MKTTKRIEPMFKKIVSSIKLLLGINPPASYFVRDLCYLIRGCDEASCDFYYVGGPEQLMQVTVTTLKNDWMHFKAAHSSVINQCNLIYIERDNKLYNGNLSMFTIGDIVGVVFRFSLKNLTSHEVGILTRLAVSGYVAETNISNILVNKKEVWQYDPSKHLQGVPNDTGACTYHRIK